MDTREPSWYRKAYWRDLTDSELNDVERRCKDIHFSSSLMINPEESLRSLLEQDEATLKRNRITHRQIADVLTTIYSLGCDNECCTTDLVKNNKINERFKIKVCRFRGSQQSPFEHDNDETYYGRSSGNCNVIVTRIRDNKQFQYGHLLIDMIFYNGFFEGVTGIDTTYDNIKSFRVDPQEVIDFFKIKPDVDYSIKYVDEYCWSFNSSHGPDLPIKVYEELALDSFDVEGGKMYLTYLDTTYDCNHSELLKISGQIFEKAVACVVRLRFESNRKEDYMDEYMMSNIDFEKHVEKTTREIIEEIDFYKDTGKVQEDKHLVLYGDNCRCIDETEMAGFVLKETNFTCNTEYAAKIFTVSSKMKRGRLEPANSKFQIPNLKS